MHDIVTLGKACKDGDNDTMNDIIASGAVDINEKYDGATPLHWAMRFNQVSTVGILLSVPTVHIDSTDMYNHTPLHRACCKGSLSSIQLYTSDTRCTTQILNMKDIYGKTALMWAVYYGHLDVVKYLATVPGVDFNTKDNNGKNIQDVARDRKCTGIVKFLLERINPNEGAEKCDVSGEEFVTQISLKVTNVDSKDMEEADDLADNVIAKAEKDLRTKITQIKCMKNEKKELEKQLLDKNDKLKILRNKTEQDMEAKYANLMEITNKITKLETEKVNLQSEIQKEADVFKMKENEIKTEVDKVEEMIKSLDLKIKTKECKDPMVEFLTNQIATKQRDLECPVCLEVAKPPIYSCSKSHLVCHRCRLRIERCPECREKYKGEMMRHRYAEMNAKELEIFLQERETQVSKLK